MALQALVLASATALCFPSARAVVPKQYAAFGIALGATPHAVTARIMDLYRECTPGRSVYRALRGDTVAHTAAVEINPGLSSNDFGPTIPCTYSPAGEGVTDGIDARFVHPAIEAGQPLYFLETLRLYPDAVYAQPPVLRHTFDRIRAELIRTYGRPTDQKRERVVSASANFATSLGVASNVKREDYLVRFLWAANGRLAGIEREDGGCECEGPYVKAVLEISRSPATIPKNKFYVLSTRLVVEDVGLRGRQDAWNAQWQQTR